MNNSETFVFSKLPQNMEELRMSGLKKSWVTAWKHFAQAKRLSFEEIY